MGTSWESTLLEKLDSGVDVAIQDQHSQPVELYLHIHLVDPAITVNTLIGDESITVDANTSIAAGQVITIYEGTRFYQSIVTGVSSLVVSLASPLDFAFTTDADVHIGPWNLAVNGASTTQEAVIIAPPLVKFDLYTIAVSMTDDAVMDSSKFGGISALTNGILFQHVDGTTKNLPLIVNNSGFNEFGFDVEYDPKPPSGVYGLRAAKSYNIKNGVSIRLDGTTADELKCLIRDDLTGLTLMSITVQGHVVEGN